MSLITVAEARAKAATYSAIAEALSAGADKAEAAGQANFDTLDALDAAAHASLDKLDADLAADKS